MFRRQSLVYPILNVRYFLLLTYLLLCVAAATLGKLSRWYATYLCNISAVFPRYFPFPTKTGTPLDTSGAGGFYCFTVWGMIDDDD